ncbi:MotA/TolQ/ExbB proton channel family protein [Novipirellula caenicola]|uniref:MotA/TolQ/ExbB proton channel domain-containing protein n=1 Tax=Novipirellula caenicola TaxID=1536901 RepID=A0ABP9VPG9_9BACT
MNRKQNDVSQHSPKPVSTHGMSWGALGIVFSGVLYAGVYASGWAPLERYFLGHPVAVAATVLFCVAVAVLLGKFCQTSVQWNTLSAIRDEDLLPTGHDKTLAQRWRKKHDAGHVASEWLTQLRELPARTRSSLLLRRLEELLTRQSQRGSTKNLSDDLRELSGRDADAAYDSFGLVRIIVWAIPMLGFLGTVIGITQTLGGLDFSDGTAAVDRLKSGLYVAFDTTALGLVLSVVSIFLQFPIERSEQRLLSAIDARVGHLVSDSLPSDDAADDQIAMITDLCEGIRIAIATSIECQSNLWRQTIDEAKDHWKSVHESDSNKIAEAFENTLRPALKEHASVLDDSARLASDRWEQQWQMWLDATSHQTKLMSVHQESLQNQYESLAELNERAAAVATMQKSIDATLHQLSETNVAIDRSIQASAGDGMADAMRVLARAVDVLTTRLPAAASGSLPATKPAFDANANANVDGNGSIDPNGSIEQRIDQAHRDGKTLRDSHKVRRAA